MTPEFRCPHCAEPLIESATSYRCATGHSFDRAREGYVNLVPSGRLRASSRSTAGDDDAMVHARREFLDAGSYDPVIDRIVAAAARGQPDFVLDAGCGEGTYLAAVTSATGASGWGIDISKAAVRLASRRHRDHRYAVASSYVLPFAAGLFDVVLNVFAPRHFPEMLRVLAPSGVAIVVTPGPDHLRQLQAGLYDCVRPHANTIEDSDSPLGAVVTARESVRFELPLRRPQDRRALVQMTPYWWSATEERRARAMVDLTEVTVDMRIVVYGIAAGDESVSIVANDDS